MVKAKKNMYKISGVTKVFQNNLGNREHQMQMRQLSRKEFK